MGIFHSRFTARNSPETSILTDQPGAGRVSPFCQAHLAQADHGTRLICGLQYAHEGLLESGKAGNYTAAVKLTQAIKNESYKSSALFEITRARSKAGDLAGVLAVANETSSAVEKTYSLVGAAEGVLDAASTLSPDALRWCAKTSDSTFFGTFQQTNH